MRYLASTIDGVPRTDNIEPYVRIIKRHSRARQALKIANSISKRIIEGVPEEEIIQDFERGRDELASSPDSEQSSFFKLRAPDLWPESVIGSELLDDIVAMISRYIAALEITLDIIALWILYSYAFDAFETSPLLAITSPEKRCGKTTLLMLLHLLTQRSLMMSNITASALFRTVEKYKPTLLIDEADSFLTGDEALRGILNSGHRKATAYVVRTVGDDYEPRLFRTWSPKAIALIGGLPDTLDDRAIVIKMQRKQANEYKEEFRSDRCIREFETLRRRAARWASDVYSQLQMADPLVPDEITNARARDNWRVLLAVSDAAGGDWSRRAREAAKGFSRRNPESESVFVLLLADIRAIFSESDKPQMTSEEIVRKLIELEHHPRGEWGNGEPISKIALAKMLKRFGIQPRKWREGKDSQRGYQRDDFEDVFARYIPIDSPHSTQYLESIAYGDFHSPQLEPVVASQNGDNSMKINDVSNVASQGPSIKQGH